MDVLSALVGLRDAPESNWGPFAMYRPWRRDVTLARLTIELASRWKDRLGLGTADRAWCLTHAETMRFIAAMLSSLVLVACQPNSVPVSLPLVPHERSELTSDDTEVIHAAIDGLITKRYGPYRQYAEKQGQIVGPASIVLVEHTIKVCDVVDYDPDWCVPPYYVTQLGRGSLMRLVRDNNRRGLQIREPPGPGVLLGQLEESSPLGGRGWRQRFNLKYPLFSYFGPVWVTVPIYPGADRALIYVQAFVSVIDPPPGGACWVHLRRYRGGWEISPESSNCRIA